MPYFDKSQVLLWAQKAVSLARERFKKNVEISYTSLKDLDEVLSQISVLLQHHHVTSGKTVENLALYFGALLGEILRQEFAGEWMVKEGGQIPYLLIQGVKIHPMEYVWHRLRGKNQWSVRDFYAQSYRKIELRGNKVPPDSTPRRTTSTQSKGKERRGKTKLIVSIIIGVVVFFVAFVALSTTLARRQREQVFRERLEEFLRQADKLDYMTEEGVSYFQFKQQLVETKVAYSALDRYWPSKFDGARPYFDKAIEGWELTAEAWDNKIDPPVLGVETFKKKVADYLGMESDSIRLDWWFGTDEIVGVLMGQASQYYKRGKQEVEPYVNK